jgi:hypothetical protein
VYDELRDVLYESAGLYRESTVREVNVTTGEVIRYVPMQPRDFAEGLALNHDRLVRITVTALAKTLLRQNPDCDWANKLGLHAVSRACDASVASCGPHATDFGSCPVTWPSSQRLSPPRAPRHSGSSM